jgi:hypothetical protein
MGEMNWQRKDGQTMRKIFFVGMMLVLLAQGCAILGGIGEKEKIYGKSVPVISQSFAPKQLRPGDTWKVYLNASDPDGDMRRIVCIIDQPGVGTYPVGFTNVREENRKELSGYIFLSTFGPYGYDWLNFLSITLTVQIQDKTGHYSQPAVFPLSFQALSTQEIPPPGIFKEQDLGPIMITLHPISAGAGNDFE